jgi:hypothetical protein
MQQSPQGGTDVTFIASVCPPSSVFHLSPAKGDAVEEGSGQGTPEASIGKGPHQFVPYGCSLGDIRFLVTHEDIRYFLEGIEDASPFKVSHPVNLLKPRLPCHSEKFVTFPISHCAGWACLGASRRTSFGGSFITEVAICFYPVRITSRYVVGACRDAESAPNAFLLIEYRQTLPRLREGAH